MGNTGCTLGAVPIWAFHGLLDDEVSPAGSIEPVHAAPELPVAASERCPAHDVSRCRPRFVGNVAAIGADNDIYAWMLGITHP